MGEFGAGAVKFLCVGMPFTMLHIPMIGKYGPLEIASWFRSGLSQTGAKPSLVFWGAPAPLGWGSGASGGPRAGTE